MEKAFTTIITFLTSLIVHAQPTVAINNHILMGTTYYSTYMVDSGFNPGQAGVNQVWNFQLIIPKSPLYYDTVDVIPSAGTFYDSLFPNATHATHAYAWSPYNNKYDYYYLSTSKVEWLGFVDSANRVQRVCSDAITELQVPLNFDSSFADSYIEANGETGIANVKYDGYGTLYLPSGVVINNAYRITTTQLLIDSGTFQTDTFNFITTNWYNPLNSFIVLQFKQSYYNNSVNGQWLYYNTSLPLNSINDLAGNTPYFYLSPNPARNYAILNFNKQVKGTVSIVNAIGMEILKMTLSSESPYLINTSGLTSGIYFVQVRNGAEKRKLLIE